MQKLIHTKFFKKKKKKKRVDPYKLVAWAVDGVADCSGMFKRILFASV